jgi:orotate phosphoribosyltransferase
VALAVAEELGVEFSYADRLAPRETEGLYPVEYRIPGALRDRLRGKRVAIVNDVVNAGSAVRGTFVDLEACGAEPVALGTLLVLGSWAATFAEERGLALETLSTLPNNLWEPSECPLCAAGAPLERLA